MLVIAGCGDGMKKSTESADSLTVDTMSVDSSLFKNPKYSNWKTVADSTYGGWHVIIRMAENGLKIKEPGTKEVWNDRSCFVTVLKNGKKLFDNKEITTASLMGGSGNPKNYLLSDGCIDEITNSTVYISLDACVPETDDGYFKLYAFSVDGTMSGYFNVGELESMCRVDDPYLMFIHELSRKSVDKKSLHKIASDYCSKQLVRQLDKNGYMSLISAKITKQHLLDYYIYSEQTNYNFSDIEKNGVLTVQTDTFKVYFCKNNTEKHIDSLRVIMSSKKDAPGKIEKIIK